MEEDLERKLKILPNRLLIEFWETYGDSITPSRLSGCEFVVKGKTLTQDDVALREVEIDLLSHGSEEINFRGVRYARIISESGINGRGEAIKRLEYMRSYKPAPVF
jgi:hypothetical protein